MASLGDLKAIKKEAWRLQLQCTRVVGGSRPQTNFWSGDETRGGAGITNPFWSPLRVVCTCKLSSNDVITNDVINAITTTDTVSTVSVETVETVETVLIVETV